MKIMGRGVTFWICFGKYGGFSIQKWKITLGWISFCTIPMDIEYLLSDMVARITELEGNDG